MIKKRIVKEAREKNFMTYKGTSIKISVDCSAEPLQVQREWDDIFKMLKETFIYQDTHIQKFLAITLQAQSNQNILDRKS